MKLTWDDMREEDPILPAIDLRSPQDILSWAAIRQARAARPAESSELMTL
jgi:hypothetical protein